MEKISISKTCKNLKDMCERKGITAYKLAIKTGVTAPAAYKWFNGYTIPSIDNLVVISQILECKIDDIIRTE